MKRLYGDRGHFGEIVMPSLILGFPLSLRSFLRNELAKN